MVIFNQWHRTPLDTRIYSDLPMSGEGSGLGAPAPALAGYLGKVQGELALPANCPWCAAKGLTCAVRSYRINLHESIILCTNLPCLFPLVSRPLEDILAGLVPPDPEAGAKKRSSGETEDLAPPSKRLRSEEEEEEKEEEARLQNGDDSHISQPEPTDMDLAAENEHPLLGTELIKGYHKDSDWPVQEEMDQEVLRDEEATAVAKKTAPACSPMNTATVDLLLSPQEAVPPSEEGEGKEVASSAPMDLKTVPLLTEGSEDDSPMSHKTAPASNNAVSTSDEALDPSGAVSSQSEENVPSVEEDVQAERPLEASFRITDHTPLREQDKTEDRPSKILTPPAHDHKEPVTEPKSSAAEDELNATDNPAPVLENEVQTRKRGRPKRIRNKVVKVAPVVVVCSDELVPAPSHLFWRNELKLCWLDSLMVAMVNCRSLREGRPEARPKRSAVWELCEAYDQAFALIRGHQQRYQDGVVRVPSSLLQTVTDKMNAQRMCIFNLLQSKLRCSLGEEETPVFAMPLLLKMDSWAEPHFQLVYGWELLCCNRISKNRCLKTLSTFTKVVSDWHPLNAAHQARCSHCSKSKQTRIMRLESVPPVFALHFEEGLPDTDVGKYSFSFQENRYSVTIVIQYLLQKHFVTWIRKPDGSWLELDDLKHPACFTHNKLPFPAHEIHIVFWERETDGQNVHTRSSSNVGTRSVVRELNLSMEAQDEPVKLLDESHNLSLPVPQDDTGIVEALTVCSDADVTMDTTELADTSIGSTTLLDTFEGLSHSDIVTLTLVEVKVDSEGKPLANDDPVPENGLSSSCEVLSPASAPDTPPHSLETSNELPPVLPTSVEPYQLLAHSAAPEPVELLDETHNLSLPVPQDDTGIVEALTVCNDADVTMDTTVLADTSIGSTTLLDTFEGLSHSDIVTLTLVEVKVDSEGKPLANDDPVPENGLSASCEVLSTDTPPHALETSYEWSPERPTSVEPCEVLAPSSAPDTPSLETSRESPPELPTSVVPCGIILPSVMSAVSAPSEVSSVETTTPLSRIPSAKPSAHPVHNSWSYLLSNHPALAHNSTSTPNAQAKHPLTNRSNTISQRRPQPLKAVKPLRKEDNEANIVPLRQPQPLKAVKPLRTEDNEALPAKAADMYGGFSARSADNPTRPKTVPHTQLPTHKTSHWTTKNGGSTAPQSFPQNPSINSTAVSMASPPPPGVTELPKVTSKKHSSQSKLPPGVNDTDALRYKLLKKLQAKKKKLEKLNQMLGRQGGAGGGGESAPKPDSSTALESPHAVSSSTSAYSPAYDQFFADLLSPATTASNLSPDSSGFLEMMANGQDGDRDTANGRSPVGGACQGLDTPTAQSVVEGLPMTTTDDHFMNEFISGAALQGQTEMETEALSALDLFF